MGENKVVQTTKEQDVKYKTGEIKSLKKNTAEVTSDRETSNTELSAVNDYFAKIKERCIAKPETYEVRKARREAEIKGLKETTSGAEKESYSFLQVSEASSAGLAGS